MHIHLHPMLVHFPVALFTTALLLEGIGLFTKKEHFHQAALNIYILGAVAAPLAVQTGLWEAQEWHLVKHPVFELHRLFAFATMFVSLASLPLLLILKEKKAKSFRKVFIILLILVACLVSSAAYHGGRLIYDYGIGVEQE